MHIPGRIPITIQPWFVILALLIGFLSAGFVPALLAIWFLVVLVGVLFHEFGHALSAMAFGQKARIELNAFGGVTTRSGKDVALWQDFVVVICGPLFGFALAGFSYSLYLVLGKPTDYLGYALFVSSQANTFWSIVNLVPVSPLDGGRLLGIILEALFGSRGMRFNFLFGAALGSLLGLAAFQQNEPIMGLLLLMLSFESLRAWTSTKDLTESDRDHELQRLFRDGERAFRAEQFDHALGLFRQILEKAHDGLLYQGAAQYVGMIHYSRGELGPAYEVLLPLETHLSGDSLRILHQLAYQREDYESVRRTGAKTYQQSPNYETAYMNAVSHAVVGEAEQAVGWLECAVRDGISNLHASLTRASFDPIRRHRLFQDFIREIT